MMLATEPRMVRLPASVVASAMTFHISSGWAKLPIHLPATSTKGTLEKTFEPSAENQARFHAWLATRSAEDAVHPLIDLVRQTGSVQPFDDDEQRGEEDQQVPVHQLEHFVRVAPRQHHDQRAAGQRGPGQVQARHEAGEHQRQHGKRQDQQPAVQRAGLCLPGGG